MSTVFKTLNLPIDYKIDYIYRIILSNFQRADNQRLENTFLCDYNSFRGFIKDIAPGILVRNMDNSIEKRVFEGKRNTPITSDEMVDFLQKNNVRDICFSLLEEDIFYDVINNLSIQVPVLKRKVGLLVFLQNK